MVIKKQHPDVCSTYEDHPVPCLGFFTLVTLLIHMPLSTDIPRISLIKTVTCVRNVTSRYTSKTKWVFRYYSTNTRLIYTVKNYLSVMLAQSQSDCGTEDDFPEEAIFFSSADRLDRLWDPSSFLFNAPATLSGAGLRVGAWSGGVENEWRYTSTPPWFQAMMLN